MNEWQETSQPSFGSTNRCPVYRYAGQEILRVVDGAPNRAHPTAAVCCKREGQQRPSYAGNVVHVLCECSALGRFRTLNLVRAQMYPNRIKLSLYKFKLEEWCSGPVGPGSWNPFWKPPHPAYYKAPFLTRGDVNKSKKPNLAALLKTAESIARRRGYTHFF